MIGPIIFGALMLPVPYFSFAYLWLTMILLIPAFLFAFYLDLTGKNRSDKLRGYAGYFSLLLLSIFFGLPGFKLYAEYPILQILILVLYVVVLAITTKFNIVMKDIVLGKRDELRRYTFVYYGIAVFIVLAGGGGYFKAAEIFSSFFGHNATMSYFSFLLLMFSYWLGVLAQSSIGVFTKFK
jgi:hypothetical protein